MSCSTFINNKYKIISKLGNGSFGNIYKGINTRTMEHVAIKVEPIVNDTNLLKNEAIIYRYLNDLTCVPLIKWYGKDKDNYYMVINLLGKSIQDVKNEIYKFSLKDTLKIGIFLIKIIRNLHERGIIHRDIKPDNFLFDTDNKSFIYIIDFGFSKTYILNNKHIEQTKTNGIIGSLHFVSLNGHDHNELSRRDDLESLCYMLIYINNGILPWQIENPSIKDKKTYVKNEKIKLLDKSSNINNVFVYYLNYIHSIKFNTNPDYEYLINLFNDLLHNNKVDLEKDLKVKHNNIYNEQHTRK